MPPWRRLSRLHRLNNPRIRADMSKTTLYNLSRQFKVPSRHPNGRRLGDASLFKMQWLSKSVSRAYHGERVLEKHWKRLFAKYPHSVVPMNPDQLAEDDGRKQSAGRGMGLTEPLAGEARALRSVLPPVAAKAAKADEEAEKARSGRGGPGASSSAQRRRALGRPTPLTPYMQMVYWPLERRLDTAIFRALFASSARQARQFVRHGHVKVNGKSMKYPAYMLNPGDMFSVDPDVVQHALSQDAGPRTDARGAGGVVEKLERLSLDGGKSRDTAVEEDQPEQEENPDASLDAEAALYAASNEAEASEEEASAEAEAQAEQDDAQDPRTLLRRLRANTKQLLTDPKTKTQLSARQKQQLRSFSRRLRLALSHAARVAPSELEDLDVTFAELSSFATTPTNTTPPPPSTTPDSAAPARPAAGPPWRPRAYLPAFAFVPRYLEVHHGVCHAVYLRHPQCGPGFAEVPSPFGEDTNRCVFGWYVRRAHRRGRMVMG